MANRLRDVIDSAYTHGRYTYSSFRKVSAIATSAGCWADLSMAPGNPVPNYYVGDQMMATVPDVVAGSYNWYKKGIWHGGSVAPYKKFLHKICMVGTGAGAAPATFFLCDYLMFYPLIDMDSTDEQLFINYGAIETDTTSPDADVLPRYTEGVGVQAFLVATNPYIGGQYFQLKYTNSAGVANRYSAVTITNTATLIGTILNSGTAGVRRSGAFVELQQGDLGIRSVQSIQFFASNGGLATLVLVRPIATMMTREPTAWAEFDFIKDKPSLPRIIDGAYLNWLVLSSATIAAVPIIGEITTIWSE